MNDRELLEAAARAAGIELAPNPFMHRHEGYALMADGRRWGPLTDDGDALRLAVKLEMTVTAGQDKCSASWWVRPSMIELDEAVEVTGIDPYAATRRAIVRAAAALGAPK